MKNIIKNLLLPAVVLFVTLALAGCMKDKSDYGNVTAEPKVRVLNILDGTTLKAVGTTPVAPGREITALGVHMTMLTKVEVDGVSTPIVSVDFKTLIFNIPAIIVATPTEVDVTFFQGEDVISTLKATIAASM